MDSLSREPSSQGQPTRKPVSDQETPSLVPDRGIPKIEDDFEKLRFHEHGQAEGVVSPDNNAPSADPSVDERNLAAIESCRRTGEVFKVLFPDGLTLSSEHEFAMFRLLDRLIGNVAQFAQTGMTNKATLRAIAVHAGLLEGLISSRD
jgi:hypothetical protein